MSEVKCYVCGRTATNISKLFRPRSNELKSILHNKENEFLNMKLKHAKFISDLTHDTIKHLDSQQYRDVCTLTPKYVTEIPHLKQLMKFLKENELTPSCEIGTQYVAPHTTMHDIVIAILRSSEKVDDFPSSIHDLKLEIIQIKKLLKELDSQIKLKYFGFDFKSLEPSKHKFNVTITIVPVCSICEDMFKISCRAKTSEDDGWDARNDDDDDVIARGGDDGLEYGPDDADVSDND